MCSILRNYDNNFSKLKELIELFFTNEESQFFCKKYQQWNNESNSKKDEGAAHVNESQSLWAFISVVDFQAFFYVGRIPALPMVDEPCLHRT